MLQLDFYLEMFAGQLLAGGRLLQFKFSREFIIQLANGRIEDISDKDAKALIHRLNLEASGQQDLFGRLVLVYKVANSVMQ